MQTVVLCCFQPRKKIWLPKDMWLQNGSKYLLIAFSDSCGFLLFFNSILKLGKEVIFLKVIFTVWYEIISWTFHILLHNNFSHSVTLSPMSLWCTLESLFTHDFVTSCTGHLKILVYSDSMQIKWWNYII